MSVVAIVRLGWADLNGWRPVQVDADGRRCAQILNTP